ncbi:MAG: class I SAM-dependent methyltransferase [Candidatus Lokiarchaeota archaeon]|nr:class I SAM-dependent methyltransferase [Candidatus Lokiarchaeota archaeon]
MNKKVDIISLNKQAWTRVADKHDEVNYVNINPLFYYFYENLPKGAYILDLGSGTGKPYAKLLIERGFNVLGIDISPRMVELARKYVPQADFVELSMTDIEYKNMFDGVFSSYTMLLLDPPLFEDVAKRIVRSLKKGGLFYLSLNETGEEGADVDKEVFVEIMGENMYSRAYSKEEVLKMFSNMGMELLKFYRETLTSKEFGIEHSTVYVFKKK